MLTIALAILIYFAPKYCRTGVISHATAFLYIWIGVSFLVETLPWLLPVSFLAKSHIFICATAFVGGTYLGNRSITHANTYTQSIDFTQTSASSKRFSVGLCVVNGILIIFVLLLFYSWLEIASASPQEFLLFMNESRYDAVHGESIFANFPIYIKSSAGHLFIFTIYLISSGKTNRPWMPILWTNIFIAATGSMLEGARSGLILYFLSFFAALHASGKISLKQASTSIIVLVIGFIVLAVAIRPSSSDSDTGAKLINHLLTYALAPTVLFGQWFDNPSFVFTWAGPIHFLSIFGLAEPLTRLAADTVPFWTAGEGLAGEDIEGNVYTAFCVVMSNIGFLPGLIYWLTCGWACGAIEFKKSPLFLSLYSLTLPSMILTIFAEYFVSNIILTLKLVLLHLFINSSNAILSKKITISSNNI